MDTGSQPSREIGSDGPLVSVIMATFNEEQGIVKDAIESILQQTYSNFELLIYDDSTDLRTRKVIDSCLLDPRVRVFREDRRVGFVRSLNLGLKAARGKYIARMDGDDISLPERLQKEVAYLEKHQGISVVGSQIDIMDEKGNVLSARKYPYGGIRLNLYAAVRCPVAHPTVMMRREIIDAGFFYDEKLERSEDLDLWLRLMNQSYKIANLKETLLKYRISAKFSEKRSCREQKESMAMVRQRNFSWRRPVSSALSWCFAWLFLRMPIGIVKGIYGLENDG